MLRLGCKLGVPSPNPPSPPPHTPFIPGQQVVGAVNALRLAEQAHGGGQEADGVVAHVEADEGGQVANGLGEDFQPVVIQIEGLKRGGCCSGPMWGQRGEGRARAGRSLMGSERTSRRLFRLRDLLRRMCISQA